MGLIFGFIGSNTVLVITMIGDWDPSDWCEFRRISCTDWTIRQSVLTVSRVFRAWTLLFALPLNASSHRRRSLSLINYLLQLTWKSGSPLCFDQFSIVIRYTLYLFTKSRLALNLIERAAW